MPMRALQLMLLVAGLAGCGGGQKLPPGVALMPRYQVTTRGIPGGAGLQRLAVVQERRGGLRLDRALAEALRRSGRSAAVLPAGTVGAETAAQAVGAQALIRARVQVRRDVRARTAERHTVTRPQTGVTTYITPPRRVDMPDDVLLPVQAQEQVVVESPLDEHLVGAELLVEIRRVADGRVVAAWREGLGAYQVQRPPPGAGPAPRQATGGAGRAEERAPAWVAVLAEAGSDLVRWLQAPRVTVARPLWKVDEGPAKEVTRRALDAVREGRWDRAESLLREAQRRAPKDPRTHANLAVALERRGDRAGAYAELRVATRLERRGARVALTLREFRRTYLPPPDPTVTFPGPASAPASTPASAPAP